MAEPLTIPTSTPEHPILDFSRLREEGIAYIQRLCGTTWTDHNTHDPGITLLEALCYALTDIGYRASASIEDILEPAPGPTSGYSLFQTAKQALATEPVTVLDYRKLFIDCHEDILNAWLTPNGEKRFFIHCKSGKILTSKPADTKGERYEEFVLNGLYTVLIQLDPLRYPALAENGALPMGKNDAVDFDALIKKTYHAHRNLCEDLVRISRVPEHTFSICADILVAASADIDAVHARILYEVQHFLTPPVNRYTLQQMQEKGVPPEQIFNGPNLQHGFIDDSELLHSRHPETGLTIRTSDLIGVIMRIPGVENIHKIHLKVPDAPDAVSALWSLDIPLGYLPVLSDLALGAQYKKSPIRFYKDQFRFNSKPGNVRDFLLALTEASRAKQRNVAQSSRDLPIPRGSWLDLGRFSSTQRELPNLYGIGEAGQPPNADNARRAKIKQLQSYLLLFDLMLTNHAAILGNIPGLLSPQPVEVSKAPLRHIAPLLFPEGIPDIERLFVKLIGELDPAMKVQRKTALLHALNSIPIREGLTVEQLNQQNRNRLLDHLLARYAENFDEYVLMMHRVFGGKRQAWEIIDDKNDFLAEYELLSKHRARAFDYLTTTRTDENGNTFSYPLWYDQSAVVLPAERINVAGIVRRAARLAGIDNYRTRDLANINYTVLAETDPDGNTGFTFRIVDINQQKVMLSALKKYTTEAEALSVMKAAVGQALFPDGYDRRVASNGKFYFNIVDNDKTNLARRVEYFDTIEDMEAAIQYLIDFLTQEYSEEGVFVIEHILLRPETIEGPYLPVCTDENCSTCASLDPYSFRISVVLPGWTPRFTNMAFRDFFERTLRTELPAHIVAKVCWIGKPQMLTLEDRYKQWLDYKHASANNGSDPTESRLTALIDILNQLYSIFPPGTLHDCEEDPADRPIVLGRSHLGSTQEVDLVFNTPGEDVLDEGEDLPIFR